MTERFANFGKRLVLAAFGTAIALAWFTHRGGGGSIEAEELDELPRAVFGGGAGRVVLEIEVAQASRLVATFERGARSSAGEESEVVHVEQALEAGAHRLEVDVSPGTYVYAQLDVPEPALGAKIVWTVRLGDAHVFSDAETLAEPLRPGYAFFVNFEIDDLTQLRELTGK